MQAQIARLFELYDFCKQYTALPYAGGVVNQPYYLVGILFPALEKARESHNLGNNPVSPGLPPPGAGVVQ